jgi:hypothetical protein
MSKKRFGILISLGFAIELVIFWRPAACLAPAMNGADEPEEFGPHAAAALRTFGESRID